MSMLTQLRSRIQYKIILPFLLLTLLVALAGSAIALLLITGNAQERLNNQLAQAARDAGDAIVQAERANLAFLREIAFAPANPYVDAPAVASALGVGDRPGLERAIEPYFRISGERGAHVDRLIVFDRAGMTLLDWERPANALSSSERTSQPASDLSALWFVPQIIGGQQDPQGDKFAGLLELGPQARYLFTVAPIVEGQQIVGGVIAAVQLDSLVRELAAHSQAAIVTVHDAASGAAFASTAAPLGGLARLGVREALTPLVRKLQDQLQGQGVFDTVAVNERDYQFAYAPLRIRGAVIGLLSVALASDYVIAPWADARLSLGSLTILLMLMIIGLGFFIARQITQPLQDLVSTAEAVSAGDLERRSKVHSRDEVGVLARSFNSMTGHLLTLFRTVRSEANQRAAIFESIADGIVVVDAEGAVVLTNPALRRLLDLPPGAELPDRFAQIPLAPLDRAAMHFGGQSVQDLFQLGPKIVRVTRSAVRGDSDLPAGYVYVLQDMTSEVEVDQAKTNFIATISHELRTPMTVISGNVDLMLSGLLGEPREEHLPFVQSIRRYTTTTTSLINNMITAAGLDAGSITFDIEPVDLAELLDEQLKSFKQRLIDKDLRLRLELAEELPPVAADYSHLRDILRQIFDNACRYTESGEICVRARVQADSLRIDICDTGPGIAPELHEKIFERFTRGPEGINSTERGIGLGLALARELIERQGGQIWLDQSSPSGSTFSMTLPIDHDHSTTEPASVAKAA